MTVVHTDYLKSNPATKQESQLKRVEQSALGEILCVSIVSYTGENQASRVRTTRSEACGACSGG